MEAHRWPDRDPIGVSQTAAPRRLGGKYSGAIDFGGSAMLPKVRRMLENLWARLATP